MKGLEALKDATELVATLPELPREPAPTEREQVKLGAKHKEHIAWLEAKGYGKWDNEAHLFDTHTCHVAELCEHFDLPGDFETNASGKDGAAGRNCCLIPRKRGLWLCVRYNTSDEDGPGWKLNAKGHMQCVVGKAAPQPKIDHADVIVSDAQATDAFFHWQGVAYVEVSRHGRKETLLVASETYARLLRVRYRRAHGRVSKAEWVKNATDMLCALAVEEGEEIPVYVRLAHVGGKLYIDLADRERHVVEIGPDGYRVLETEAPARFLRTDKMLPLPIPQPGGSLEDLRPFVNVEEEDFPLLIGAILGMLQPDGTLPVLSIIGGDGRAKTCLAIIILMLIDPSIIKGCAPPENNEDLVLAVQQRWVYFIDNLSEIKPWLSDALCRLATGGATERRTKYKDRDTTVILAKRPVLTTSIIDVVRAADLILQR